MPKPPVSEPVAELLAKANPATITTLRKDGTPVSVATWYLWQNGQVLVNMDVSRKRLEHMRRDPRVALTVLDSDGWYRHVSLQGRVARLYTDGDLTDIDRLARHYIGKQYPERSRGRVSALIDIDQWFAWGIDD
ncbi:PPOX class F420-dependent oxidoreductase [Allostreptomyces psammosilenae]|uniref:PPOX class probable F420-dependent enzyme n=1 Tax=Allostreptomyces psammosilenae TaxID=1892865 RepID=A0A853ABD5_9ACTN|nr:PPOX class F420-dependent oxidoreductase [Allostreptomyces psammosilenae]NYI07921.1 PPOX class probable F420-dependent enzyme [Allostreptomyces psammosilenae]